MQWLCILTGGSGCGKTSLARLLAQLSAHRLSEVVLSTATDTTELLGCFEQNEPSRLQEAALLACRDLADEVTQALLLLGSDSSDSSDSSGSAASSGAPGGRGERRAECLLRCAEIQQRWEPLAPLAAATHGGARTSSSNPNPDPNPNPNPNPNPDPNPNPLQ